jgi:hypothetical protein
MGAETIVNRKLLQNINALPSLFLNSLTKRTYFPAFVNSLFGAETNDLMAWRIDLDHANWS